MITEVKMTNQFIDEAISLLTELKGDSTVPKNIKAKIENIISVLEKGPDVSIRVNKAMNQLEEVADDSNLQPYSRTQVWNIVSLLEKA